MAWPNAVRLAVSHSSSPVLWALGELQSSLGKRKIALDADAPFEIALEAAPAELAISDRPESYALFETEGGIGIWGADERGLVYALTELADRVSHAVPGEALFGQFPIAETPTAAVRSIARLFCSEEEDKIWFYDRNQWSAYLDMLASNRINRFSLTLGMGYNYPGHNLWITDVYFYFAYPYLLDMPGYGVEVEGLSRAERQHNLETLQFVARETARRGMEFQLALWTQRYDFDDVPRARQAVMGVTADNLAPYCRDAVAALLTEVPEITGITFRVHVEGGISEGDYHFWEEVFAGVAAAGRPVEIDMHGKGLDYEMLDVARRSGMPFAASPKYMSEHLGLPYHQSAIRNREYPKNPERSDRERISAGSRSFLRYSYGDLLQKDKDYKVIFRIWPGTQRVLLWGDPELAAGYGRSSMFAGADGVELCEPLSFKGRMGTGIPGGRLNYQRQDLLPRYDWEKYRYQYRVWGRLLYNPEAPRDSWMRELRSECGDAADLCERALGLASRVLPLVSIAHAPSASNNHYWPEIYTNISLIPGNNGRAYAFDMEGEARFGNVATFDFELFSSPREYAESLLAGRLDHRYSPLDVADWLEEIAAGVEHALIDIKARRAAGRVSVQRLVIDAGIAAGIARFFAERFRAAIYAEIWLATHVTSVIDTALDYVRRSVTAWEGVAAISREVYDNDITYGPQSWMRGSWHTRLDEIRAEILDIEASRGAVKNYTGAGQGNTTPMTPAVEAALAAIASRRPVAGRRLATKASERVNAGQPFEVRVEGRFDAPPMLHYRHVNQAERWTTLPMMPSDGAFVGVIPADYTESRFHLQYFVTASVDEAAVISPGLAGNLANEPYDTALQA
ncbi:hypothetical protein LB518_19355 [Mesorhizobium sp. BR1-1-16]|uniref:hypothetical protein n=1 Tax=Mesorhizobium sp. BR1-1-16 TaxID=2876653 RepID=UPI001CCFC096|nr:hypothetical protein [Mesorhizobium sp. BR1-1-16]MBZ9938466.1 hypothetical protein [Mesorhizobium sp. BR1-1-16]